MLSILLLLMAGALMAGVNKDTVLSWWNEARSRISPRLAGAILLAIAAAFVAVPSSESPEPDPSPVFDLRGVFVGPLASDDAATVGALLAELADEIEIDGRADEPGIRTGAQVDSLRKTARTLRCRGESIGERQPAARDMIAAYLDEHVGHDGGPLTQESRSAWVSAFREVGEAASAAAR